MSLAAFKRPSLYDKNEAKAIEALKKEVKIKKVKVAAPKKRSGRSK